MCKFQSSTCKTVGEKLRTKLRPWTDRQTAMAIPVYPPPHCCRGYNKENFHVELGAAVHIFLILYHNPNFNEPEERAFRKHFGKRRKCW